MTVRPLGPWPGERTKVHKRTPFYTKSSTVANNLALLRTELRHLGATRVVLEADFREGDLRMDGWPRSSARPMSSAVILRVLDSKYGPLSYPCDTFPYWEDNIRAIALALEALRKVDRYGVTKRGEQYTGWKAIPPTTGATMTTEAAANVLAQYFPTSGAGAILQSPETAKRAGLAALRQTHPDTGGKAEDFNLVQLARAVLASHHGAM